ncbi:mycofactocin biosynthesis chaperone MftB [Nocardioides hungaricus]
MNLDEPWLDQSWALSPSVALRPEPFGALAYHFGNRRLVFLKRPELVAVVRGLGSADGDGSVRSALVAAGVPEESWPVYLSALEGLAESAMICRSAA